MKTFPQLFCNFSVIFSFQSRFSDFILLWKQTLSFFKIEQIHSTTFLSSTQLTSMLTSQADPEFESVPDGNIDIETGNTSGMMQSNQEQRVETTVPVNTVERWSIASFTGLKSVCLPCFPHFSPLFIFLFLVFQHRHCGRVQPHLRRPQPLFLHKAHQFDWE